MNGSGWIVEKMLSLDVNVFKMANPLYTIDDQEKEEDEEERETGNPDVYRTEGRYDEIE